MLADPNTILESYDLDILDLSEIGTIFAEKTKNSDLPVKPVDVAIIGAGYTGLSTALHAALKGLTAHVVEAQHIGYGGSGRNVGLILV